MPFAKINRLFIKIYRPFTKINRPFAIAIQQMQILEGDTNRKLIK